MSIKRFDESCIEGGGVAPHENGEYVKYADHIAIQQRLTVAEQRVIELESAAREMLRIAAIAKQGSNAYNRAIINLHSTLNTAEGEGL